ncbi:MAG: radical SAM family heme chaperone HemW [Acidobacteriota bacterium]
METLGIYIQVPFCASKCSFCNFSSRVVRQDVYDRYCQTLGEEIKHLSEFYRPAGIDTNLLNAPVDSVYIGGGTPSLMGGDRLAEIVESLQRRFQFVPRVEFTLEVTPGSANSDCLKQALAFGVNRLSIGAQSFADAELRSVGRLHSAEDTRALIQDARDHGFSNISLDLIAGLPCQSADTWQSTLESAIGLRPEHFSVYLFEIDKKSRLGREVLRHGDRYHADEVPDEDFMADAYDHARRLLGGQGYIQYEISNFALPGFESIHNRKYWQLRPYLGLGAGAHSCDGQHRWANATTVEEYEGQVLRGKSPICEQQTLSSDAQVEEFFFLGLRQREGINLAEAGERWGRERVERWAQKIESLENGGQLERIGGRIRLADSALLVSNEVFQEFISS